MISSCNKCFGPNDISSSKVTEYGLKNLKITVLKFYENLLETSKMHFYKLGNFSFSRKWFLYKEVLEKAHKTNLRMGSEDFWVDGTQSTSTSRQNYKDIAHAALG